jgi:hypothetical protein
MEVRALAVHYNCISRIGRLLTELLWDTLHHVAHGTGVTVMENLECSCSVQRLT